jgi:hypothetical protein
MILIDRNIIAQIASIPIPQRDRDPFFPKWKESVFPETGSHYLETIVRCKLENGEQYQIYVSDYSSYTNVEDVVDVELKKKQKLIDFIEKCYTIAMTSYSDLKDIKDYTCTISKVLDNCQITERLLYTDKYNREKIMKEMEFWNLENEN